MRLFTVDHTGKIYDISDSCRINSRSLCNRELEDLYKHYRSLRRSLRGSPEEDYWRGFFAPVRKYLFTVCAAPVPPNNPWVYDPSLADFLRDYIKEAEQAGAAVIDEARGLIERFEAMSESGGNPIAQLVEEYFEDASERKFTLLLKEKGLVKPTQKALEGWGRRRLRMITPADLRGGECFDAIIAFGPVNYFPEFVYSAPRAYEILVLYYDFFRFRLPPKSYFIKNATGQPDYEVAQTWHEISEETALILPEIDWDRIKKEGLGAVPSERGPEDVEAKLFLLEGGKAVFVDVEEGSKALVIDPYADEGQNIMREYTKDIKPGMFILLRTSGGGDYIVPLADRILGEDQATQVRELQRDWKQRLRSIVDTEGIQEVSSALLRRGSKLASEQNLRNWMSYRSIKTRERSDFSAVMDLVGLHEKTDEYWEALRAIDQAHRMAGQHIRKLLIEKARRLDMGELVRMGTIVFELQDKDSGSLTAFRVLDISSDTTMVAPHQISQPFEVGDGLWQ